MKSTPGASVEERLRTFSRRYTSVETSGDGENDEHTAGYFSFYVGRTENAAKNAGQATGSVVFAEPDRTEAVLLDKVTELLNRREGHVWVYAYWSGSGSYDAKLKIEGSTEDAKQPPVTMDHGPIAALAEQNIRMAAMVMDDNENLRARLEKHQEFALIMVEKLTTEHIYRRAYEEGASASQMAGAIEAASPLVAALGPVLVAKLAGGGAIKLPDEPKPRLQTAVGVIMGMMDEIRKVLTKAPELGADLSTFQPLKAVILAVGPALGLQVVDLAGDTAPGGAA